HAIWLRDVTTKLAQILFRKTDDVQVKILELFVDLLFIENTNDRVFAVNRRHDRNAEVDVASFVTNTKTTVLRHATLRDVELRHDLDTRDQPRVIGEIDRIDFRVERAVDSILDLHFSVASFDVNIGRARLHRVVDDRVDQLDDGRHLGVGRESIEIEHFFAVLSLFDK